MLFTQEIAERIEDALSKSGVPTRAYRINQTSELEFGIVFPMAREFDLREGLIRAQEELAPLVGAIEYIPRTVLRYFSAELFGSVSKAEDVFLSTNITNLLNPHEAKKNVSAHAGAAYRGKLPRGKWKAEIFTYDINFVIISAVRNKALSLIPKLREAAEIFNTDSRFLKIGQLQWAWTPSRIIVATEPGLTFVAVPPLEKK